MLSEEAEEVAWFLNNHLDENVSCTLCPCRGTNYCRDNDMNCGTALVEFLLYRSTEGKKLNIKILKRRRMK